MGHPESQLERVSEYVWEVPKLNEMRVPARVIADETLVRAIQSDGALQQAINVASLPGIVRASYAMPDAHWGYGFPIGGVAAFDPEQEGVISPGGIGYDINCGVRLVGSDLKQSDVRDRIEQIADALYREVPCGVGSSGAIKELSEGELRKVMVKGARWAVENGMGTEEDLRRTEAGGAMEAADPDQVSSKAVKRGRPQVGTLGSGNHFLEVDVVEQVFDEKAAGAFGVREGEIAFQIHCGSRGFGHQICTDFINVMRQALKKYGIQVPDKQLCCAPINSEEGKRYFGAMAAGANYAWCNRQVIFSMLTGALKKVFDADRDSLGIRQVYDVCHNIAKFEEHEVEGQKRTLCVHRKGATRAFPPGHPEVPEPYREVGQPVLIPGDMGTCSYLLVGTEGGMRQTWGSTCHGAGRVMSRKEAKRKSQGRNLVEEMKQRGVVVRAKGMGTVAEEMSHAYKDVDAVVAVMHNAGLTRKVARLKPLAVVKG